MGLFDKLINNIRFDNFVITASDEELANEYEKVRQDWIKNGFNDDGSNTEKMNKLNNEMSRRAAEKWEKDPNRNTDPNFRWTDANRWDRD